MLAVPKVVGQWSELDPAYSMEDPCFFLFLFSRDLARARETERIESTENGQPRVCLKTLRRQFYATGASPLPLCLSLSRVVYFALVLIFIYCGKIVLLLPLYLLFSRNYIAAR